MAPKPRGHRGNREPLATGPLQTYARKALYTQRHVCMWNLKRGNQATSSGRRYVYSLEEADWRDRHLLGARARASRRWPAWAFPCPRLYNHDRGVQSAERSRGGEARSVCQEAGAGEEPGGAEQDPRRDAGRHRRPRPARGPRGAGAGVHAASAANTGEIRGA